MFRRLFVFSLALLLVCEPAFSQIWLQRYLRERKARDESKKTATPPDDASEPVVRAEPVNDTATPAPGATMEEPVAIAEPVAPPQTPIPVRRAELANPTPAPTPVVTIHRAEPIEPAPAPPPRPPQHAVLFNPPHRDSPVGT